MTRTAQPHEILISAIVLLGALISFTVAGYWLGHRGMDDLVAQNRQLWERNGYLVEMANDEGWLDRDPDSTIRINAECRNDASDWATIEMANEIGYERDIPVFVHGTCLTHEVVDVPKAMIIYGGKFSGGDCSTPTGFTAQPSGNPVVKCDDGSYHEITNIPQPAGQ